MSNKKKLPTIIICLLSCLLACADYSGDLILAPTGKWAVQATVNRTDNNQADYAYVMAHLYDQNQQKVTTWNTRVGDAQKWSLGWTKYGDTIILQSSDIGTKAWQIVNNKVLELSINKELDTRAEQLKHKKYN